MLHFDSFFQFLFFRILTREYLGNTMRAVPAFIASSFSATSDLFARLTGDILRQKISALYFVATVASDSFNVITWHSQAASWAFHQVMARAGISHCATLRHYPAMTIKVCFTAAISRQPVTAFITAQAYRGGRHLLRGLIICHFQLRAFIREADCSARKIETCPRGDGTSDRNCPISGLRASNGEKNDSTHTWSSQLNYAGIILPSLLILSIIHLFCAFCDILHRATAMARASWRHLRRFSSGLIPYLAHVITEMPSFIFRHLMASTWPMTSSELTPLLCIDVALSSVMYYWQWRLAFAMRLYFAAAATVRVSLEWLALRWRVFAASLRLAGDFNYKYRRIISRNVIGMAHIVTGK